MDQGKSFVRHSFTLDTVEMGLRDVTHIDDGNFELGAARDLLVEQARRNLGRGEVSAADVGSLDQARADGDDFEFLALRELGLEVPSSLLGQGLALLVGVGLVADGPVLLCEGLLPGLKVVAGHDGHNGGGDDETLDAVLLAALEGRIGAFDGRLDEFILVLGSSRGEGRCGVDNVGASLASLDDGVWLEEVSLHEFELAPLVAEGFLDGVEFLGVVL